MSSIADGSASRSCFGDGGGYSHALSAPWRILHGGTSSAAGTGSEVCRVPTSDVPLDTHLH